MVFFFIPCVIDCLVYYIIIIHFEFRVEDLSIFSLLSFCLFVLIWSKNKQKTKHFIRTRMVILTTGENFSNVYFKVSIIRYTSYMHDLIMKAHSHKQYNISHD